MTVVRKSPGSSGSPTTLEKSDTDNKLIQKAKIETTHRRTHINEMSSEELTKAVEKTKKYQSAKRRAMDNLKTGFHLGGAITVSREDLHDR